MLCLQVFVFFLIGSAVYTNTYVCILPWMGYTSKGVALLGFFYLNMFMCAVCYAYACLLDPGTVPAGWQPGETIDLLKQAYVRAAGEDESALKSTVVAEKKTKRWCRRCDNNKPPRAHHCRICRKCVLRMDHHCPWISNCVGHRNYKAFFLFILYTVVVTFFTLFCVVGRHVYCRTPVKGVGLALTIFLGIFGILIGIMVACLLGYQASLVFRNLTTIEYHELYFQYWGKPPGEKRSSYDVGVFGNIVEIFGSNPLLWLFPTVPATDGTWFKQRDVPLSDITTASSAGTGVKSKSVPTAPPRKTTTTTTTAVSEVRIPMAPETI